MSKTESVILILLLCGSLVGPFTIASGYVGLCDRAVEIPFVAVLGLFVGAVDTCTYSAGLVVYFICMLICISAYIKWMYATN
ncbi:MAG: hypothetical protein IS632_01530 [Thaumarchaeota archaeon]|nr:hypothetical protein [Nitrososphaerota archaeon]